MICLICDIHSSGYHFIDISREVHTCDDCPHFEKNRCPKCFELISTEKPKRVCFYCDFDEAEERLTEYLLENDKGFREIYLRELAQEQMLDRMLELYKFSAEKMEAHFLLDGVKHFHLNFDNDKYFSVIGGHSTVMEVFGDGIKTFEVLTSESDCLEKHASERHINLLLRGFMRKHGFPTKKEKKEPEY
jgi:hypothetical protein